MPATSYQTIGAVAAELGVPRWRLAYLIDRGDLPGPSVQVPGRRLFSPEDVERLRLALSRHRPRRASASRPEAQAEARGRK